VLLPTTGPERSTALRITTGAYTLWCLGRRVRLLRGVHRTDRALFSPVGPCRVLRAPLPAPVADTIAAATLLSSATFTAGVAHRVLGPVHSALLLWTLSYRNSWSMVFHNDNALVLHTAALGLTPSADTLRVGTRHRDAQPSWRYSVAPAGMNLATCAVYVLSGVAKIAGPMGWRWAGGSSLRAQVDADALRKTVLGSVGGPLGPRLREHTLLFTGLAAGSLAVELLAPLALLDRRVGRVWSVLARSMHWGIKAVMGITFRHQLSGVMYLPLVLPDELRLPPAS